MRDTGLGWRWSGWKMVLGNPRPLQGKFISPGHPQDHELLTALVSWSLLTALVGRTFYVWTFCFMYKLQDEMNHRNEFMLLKPSMGKFCFYTFSHSGWQWIIPWSQDPTKGQGLIPCGCFCVHRGIIPMAYPCDTTPLQNQWQHLNLGLSHQGQCMDSISRLCWLWSLLLRLGNEGHRWERLWAGCPCTKGSSPMPGHPGTVVHDNMKEKPRGAAPSQVAQTMAVYTGSFTGIQDLSSVLYLGCKTTDIFLVVDLWHTSVFSERKNFSSWLSGGKIQPPEMLNFLKPEPGVKSWQGEFTL